MEDVEEEDRQLEVFSSYFLCLGFYVFIINVH